MHLRNSYDLKFGDDPEMMMIKLMLVFMILLKIQNEKSIEIIADAVDNIASLSIPFHISIATLI